VLNLNFSETEHATEIDFGLDIQLANEFSSHIRIHERRGALKSAHSVPHVHFGSRILLPLLYFSQSQRRKFKSGGKSDQNRKWRQLDEFSEDSYARNFTKHSVFFLLLYIQSVNKELRQSISFPKYLLFFAVSQ